MEITSGPVTISSEKEIQIPLHISLLDGELVLLDRVEVRAHHYRRRSDGRFRLPTRFRRDLTRAHLYEEDRLIDRDAPLAIGANEQELTLKLQTTNPALDFSEVTSFRLNVLLWLGSGSIVRLIIRYAEGRPVRVTRPLSFTTRTALGLASLAALAYLIIPWASNETLTYRPLPIDRAVLLMISTAVLAYFGLPGISNLKNSLNSSVLNRLRAQVKYPEYYFDSTVVAFLRNPLTIVLCTVVLTITVFHSVQYDPVPLEIEDLGSRFELTPRIATSGPDSCSTTDNDAPSPGVLAPMTAALATIDLGQRMFLGRMRSTSKRPLTSTAVTSRTPV